MEYDLLELYFPVWVSLTGAHPGLFTSENKNALESYWFVLLESIREKLKIICSDTHFRNLTTRHVHIDTRDKSGNKFSNLKRI